MSELNLVGRTFIVAGAAGLLGSQIVAGLMAHGANVYALDFSRAKLDELKKKWKDDERLSCAVIDISKVEEIEDVFRLASEKYGAVHGAVNTTYPRNANYGSKFFDVSYADFCENISLNLGCYFIFMQACARYFQGSKDDFSLVNISSVYGVTTPRFEVYEGTNMTMPVEYSAIKSALIHLSKYVAAYVKSSGFRVNLVSPGGILDGQPEDFLNAYKEHTLGAGMLTAPDMVGSILFLLSDMSRYINGQNIIVDDGFTL